MDGPRAYLMLAQQIQETRQTLPIFYLAACWPLRLIAFQSERSLAAVPELAVAAAAVATVAAVGVVGHWQGHHCLPRPHQYS